MLTRNYQFAHYGIHVVEYQAGESDIPPDVIEAAKYDGVWKEAEKPAETRQTKAKKPPENK